MKKPMSNFVFRIMDVALKFRDKFNDPKERLGRLNLQPGQRVLDFGAGPGTFSIEAAKQVGPNGKVYAVDIHPLSEKIILNKAHQSGLSNVVTILSDCHTGLNDNSVDAILLFDVYHMLEKPDCVLKECARVLKPGGIFAIHAMHITNISELIKDIENIANVSLVSMNEKYFYFKSKVYEQAKVA